MWKKEKKKQQKKKKCPVGVGRGVADGEENLNSIQTYRIKFKNFQKKIQRTFLKNPNNDKVQNIR